MAKMHWDRVAREELDRLLVFDTTGWNGSGTFVVTVTDSNNRTHGRIHSSDHHHRQRCTWHNMRHTASELTAVRSHFGWSSPPMRDEA